MEFDLAAELERVTKLGYAPQILYDDDGHFAVSGDGGASLRMMTDNDLVVNSCAESQWFEHTPKDAWENYLRRIGESVDKRDWQTKLSDFLNRCTDSQRLSSNDPYWVAREDESLPIYSPEAMKELKDALWVYGELQDEIRDLKKQIEELKHERAPDVPTD